MEVETGERELLLLIVEDFPTRKAQLTHDIVNREVGNIRCPDLHAQSLGIAGFGYLTARRSDKVISLHQRFTL